MGFVVVVVLLLHSKLEYAWLFSCCAVFYACLTIFLVNFLWGKFFDFSLLLRGMVHSMEFFYSLLDLNLQDSVFSVDFYCQQNSDVCVSFLHCPLFFTRRDNKEYILSNTHVIQMWYHHILEHTNHPIKIKLPKTLKYSRRKL